MNKVKQILLATSFLCYLNGVSQRVPSNEENIEYLVNFGKEAPDSWGDDDHVQINFFAIPETEQNVFYIRVFDPNVGGKHDQKNGNFNTTTHFSVYGGQSAYSNKEARGINPIGNFKSGVKLHEKSFNDDSKYDDQWYTFGPFNPKEGEYDKDLEAYVFKMICEGKKGNDGNLFYYFLSSNREVNKPVQGGNCFAYELCVRVNTSEKKIPHLYPFINDQIISIKQFNFDYDNNGWIRLTSLKRKEHDLKMSGDGKWASSKHEMYQSEQNSSLDIHFIPKATFSNDITIYILDQYRNAIPFFSIPLGGVPKYQYKIDVDYQFD